MTRKRKRRERRRLRPENKVTCPYCDHELDERSIDAHILVSHPIHAPYTSTGGQQ